MRQVTVTAPEGKGADIAQIAFEVGINDVSINPVRVVKKDHPEETRENIEIESATHLAKAFIETLTSSPFFTCEESGRTVRQPRSIFSSRDIRSLTKPFVEPTSDLFQELWQFCQITTGFIGRIYLGAVLLAFGIIDFRLLFMIAGLLFIPLLPLMLAIGFSLWTRQWRLLVQAIKALVLAMLLLAAGGVTIALLSHPPVRYMEANSLLTAFLLPLAA